MRNTLLSLLCLLSTSCVTAQATIGTVPKERASECAMHCNNLDMKLASVVIIRSSAGCVCAPKDAVGQQAGGVAAAASGAIIAEEEQRQQQQASYASGR